MPFVSAFSSLQQHPPLPRHHHHHHHHHVGGVVAFRLATMKRTNSENDNDDADDCTSNDRLFLKDRRSSMLSLFGLSTTTATTLLLLPRASYAGIDVSSLRVDSVGGGGGGNPDLAAQLRQYDGSAASRIAEIKKAASVPSSSLSRSTTATAKDDNVLDTTKSTTTTTTTTTTNPYAASYVYRSAPGYSPSLTKLGLGERYRLDDRVEGPKGTKPRSSSPSQPDFNLRVSFEFPSDWLQLDRMAGGLQFVDQRNGDKLYLLKVQLPPNTTLTSVDKRFLGDAIFDAQGALVQSAGLTIDSYRVGKSEILSDGSLYTTPHRRVLLKYATVTGNGLVTERRGWADAYQVDARGSDNDSENNNNNNNNNNKFAYMLVTSSNAVKFEAQGRERDTVDAIVNSFQLERI
jgi:hypothetical protein